MYRHRISPDVIMALFCFCLAGISLSVFGHLLDQLYGLTAASHGGGDVLNSEEVFGAIGTGVLGVAGISAGLGFLSQKPWANFIMQFLSGLVLVLVLYFISWSIDDMFSDVFLAILIISGGIGGPVFFFLLFGSEYIFPQLNNGATSDLPSDILDQL